MTQQTLRQLYAEHRGKVSDKWESYLELYDGLFAGFRDEPVRLLEIGIQNGGSLELWSRYFPAATRLVGCDINDACARLIYDDPRLAVVVADANTDAAEEQIVSLAPSYEIVIDDGSHRSGDIIRSFSRYFPHLDDGGLYIVEDLHCSYWSHFEGGLFSPDSAISFFKRLVDVISYEHWGLDCSRASVLEGILGTYGVTIEEEILSHVHSVEFLNSVCVVRKQPPAENTLGNRVIAGKDEQIVPGRLVLRGSVCERFDQTRVPSRRDPVVVEAELREQLLQRDGRIDGLRRAVMERDAQLADLRQRLAEMASPGEDHQSGPTP